MATKKVTKKAKPKATTKRKAAAPPSMNHLTPYAATLGAKPLFLAMSGVRGPDVDSGKLEDLKWLLTRRLRTVLFKPQYGFGYDITEKVFSQADFNQLKEIEKQGTPGWRHFVTHIRLAVQATDSHPIWGGFGRQITNRLLDIL